MESKVELPPSVMTPFIFVLCDNNKKVLAHFRSLFTLIINQKIINQKHTIIGKIIVEIGNTLFDLYLFLMIVQVLFRVQLIVFID